MLAYIDNFRMLSIVALFLIPAVLIVKKPRTGPQRAHALERTRRGPAQSESP